MKRINIITPVVGYDTSGNPWTVSNGLADELVNRGVAVYADPVVALPDVTPQALAAVQAQADAAAAAVAGKLDSAAVGVSVAPLVAGKLRAQDIPDIALQQFCGAVANQAAMLAVKINGQSPQLGDWVSRTDTGTDWRVVGDPSTLAGWLQTTYPSAPVASVNGKTGAVTLTPADVGAVPSTMAGLQAVVNGASPTELAAYQALVSGGLPGMTASVISGTAEQKKEFGYEIAVGKKYHVGPYIKRLGLAAGITACIADACAGGGLAYFPNGDYTVPAQALAAVADYVRPKDAAGNVLAGSNTWQGGGIRITGESSRHTILRSQGGVLFSLTANFSSFCEFSNLTLIGPGKSVAGSVALDCNISPQLALKNLYLRDFAVGMQFYDCTNVNANNVMVSYCGVGARFGYNSDCFNFTNCLFTLNDNNVHVGWKTGNYTGNIQNCGQITFISSLLNYSQLSLKVTDTQLTGLIFIGGYFEGNVKDGEIGTSGQTDGPGASILFDGVTFGPKGSVTPVGFDIYGRPAVTFTRCRSDGDNQYNVFCKINDPNGTRVQFEDSKIVCVAGTLQIGSRYYNTTSEYRENIAYKGQQTELHDFGFAPNKPMRQNIFTNVTAGKVLEQWEKNTTAGVQQGGIKIEMRDTAIPVLTGLGAAGQFGFVAPTLVDVLPTASATYDGALVRTAATASVPGRVYICLSGINNASYSWVQLASGI